MVEMSVADLLRLDVMLTRCREMDSTSSEWHLLMTVTLSSLSRLIEEGVYSLESRWEELKFMLSANAKEEDSMADSIIAWWQLQYPWRDGATGLSRLMWDAFPPVVCPGAFRTLMRYSTPEIERRITQRFEFMGDTSYTDWEVMMSSDNIGDIDAWLAGYHGESLLEVDREVLMFIIMDSMTQVVEKLEPHMWQPRWEKVVDLLREDIPLHAAFIGYWMCLDVEPEDRFHVSKYLIRAFPGYLGVAREGA
jgi:hypothetical protein